MGDDTHPHRGNLTVDSRRLPALANSQEKQAQQGKDVGEDSVDAIGLGVAASLVVWCGSARRGAGLHGELVFPDRVELGHWTVSATIAERN